MNEMHEKEGKQYLTSEGRINLGQNSLRNEVWSEKEEFGKVRRRVLLREIRRNERSVTQTLYIETFTARWIERYRELLRIKISQKELLSNYREAPTAK